MKPIIKFVFPFFIVVVLFSNCNSNTTKLSTECQQFESFIKSVWRFNDSTFTYYFKGNPEWWYDIKYFDESCLMGRSKKEIVKLFGSPSKEFKFINKEYITYCMEESCLFTVKSTGNQLGFFFDSTGMVNQAITSPPIQKKNEEF